MQELTPKNDLIFKMIFGNEKHPNVLIHFLNSVIEFKNPIQEVKIKKTELLPAQLLLKETRLDILAKTTDGEIINVEVQRQDEKNMVDRSLFYWAELFGGQLNKGDQYQDLRRTICINILDFSLFKEDDRFWRKNHITDDQTHKRLTDLFEIHFIELNKMQEIRKESPITFWIEFIRNPDSLAVKEICEFVPEVKEAIDMLDVVRADPESQEAIRLRNKGLRDFNSAVYNAEEKGIQKGMQKGREEGELLAKRTAAKNFYKLGVSKDIICNSLEITMKELDKWLKS